MLDLCFDSLDQNRVCFDFVLDLKLFLDGEVSVAKLHVLDFHSRNLSRALRTGFIYHRINHLKREIEKHICVDYDLVSLFHASSG